MNSYLIMTEGVSGRERKGKRERGGKREKDGEGRAREW